MVDERDNEPYKGIQGRQIGLAPFDPISSIPSQMRTANRLTQQRRAAFLDALADTANVSLSCQSAGVSRHVVYAARRADPAFAAAWADAMHMALDMLEAELIRRAVEGTEQTQFYHGKPIGTVKSYSDSLAMFLLKSHRPDVYGDLKAVANSAKGEVADQNQRDGAYERLVAALEKLEAKHSAPPEAS